MNICIGILIALLLASPLSSGEALKPKYGLIAKQEGTTPIKKFMVYSERCSGSNFIDALIKTNLNLDSTALGHKHFLPWYSLPLSDFTGDPKEYTFEGTDDYLFVVIFRNALDWASSFALHPWHAESWLINIPFSDFIRSEWHTGEDVVVTPLKRIHPYLDMNPVTLKPFANIFELRSAKIRNYLEIQNRAKNVYYVNYEVVKEHAQEVVNELAQIYHLNKGRIFIPVYYYKGNQNAGHYQGHGYPPISEEDMEYIRSQIDHDLERSIGYESY